MNTKMIELLHERRDEVLAAIEILEKERRAIFTALEFYEPDEVNADPPETEKKSGGRRMDYHTLRSHAETVEANGDIGAALGFWEQAFEVAGGRGKEFCRKQADRLSKQPQ